jgi:hypothetical protein
MLGVETELATFPFPCLLLLLVKGRRGRRVELMAGEGEGERIQKREGSYRIPVP